MAEFTWHYNYSLGDLLFRRLRLTVYRLVAFVALLLSVLALVRFVVLSLPVIESLTWQVFFPRAPGAGYFWLSVLIMGYAWYRLDRERAWYPALPPEALTITVDQYLSEETWAMLTQAFRYAGQLKQGEVAPIHLLAAALHYPTARRLFSRLGVPREKLATTLRNELMLLGQGPEARLSKEAQGVFLEAARLALARQARQVEMSEVLLALAKAPGGVQEVLEELAIPPDAVSNITSWFALRRKLLTEYHRRSSRASARPKHALDRAYLAVATPFLNRMSRDLTSLAAGGYLNPCVGREAELAEVYRIIEGGHASVVLLGEAGVGKSSLVEGIAQAMVAEEVPELLQDKHLLLLSLPQLLSGATPAQASERLLHAVTEVVRAGNVVLGIENIDQLVTPGMSSQGEIGPAEVLAQAVAQHGLVVLATATAAAWNETLVHSALGQALQPVQVPELDDNHSIQVLESRVPALESEHHVYFAYGALQAAVELSRRYLPDRFLPEKAIKLLEEVAIYARDRHPRGTAVGAEDVAQVVAGKVHVPVTQVTQGEREKLLNLEDILHRRIVGQDEAVNLVAQALRRARVNLRDQKRPIASFLFLGPTGVGKTELAKTVAAEYFGGENKMVRLDMSEYQTAESLYRLIGAPAGTGSSSGLLTEAVRRNPYTLLLLDELEKAHLDILNVFLQLLDDGRLTDAAGKTVDFTNCIVIATSNAGTSFIQHELQAGTALEAIRKQLLERELQQYFRPEFLNRFDGIVVFKPLGMPEVVKVTELLLAKLSQGLEAKGVHLKASPEAVAELAHKGFDPLFGARPLRRVIQENVDNALATYLLTGKLTRRDVVVLEPGGVVRVEKAGKL